MSPEMKAFAVSVLEAGRTLQLWLTCVLTDDLCARDVGDEFRRLMEQAYRTHAELQKKRTQSPRYIDGH